jgi:hypothetical protein
MRFFDGSLVPVQWCIVENPNAPTLQFGTPFVSGRNDPYGFDLGFVGEVPNHNAANSRLRLPPMYCLGCYAGAQTWWESGWPNGTTPVILDADGWPTECGSGMGTVFSVGLALPSEFVVSGSPVTTIGTLAGDWADQPAGTVLAGPVSGPPGKPSFKTLVLPPTFTIPTAQWRIVGGTTLSGTYSIGPIALNVGDRVLTWDGVSHATWGIWIVAVGAWTRAPELPAGTVFDGPAYAWIASDEEVQPSYPILCVLFPATWGPGTNPTSWTIGTDPLICCYASPGTTVAAGTFITVTPTISRQVAEEFTVNYTGPLSLDSWATLGGPISTTNINTGALPGGVTIAPTQLTAGVIAAGVTIPYTQVTSPPPAGAANVLFSRHYVFATNTPQLVATIADSDGLHGSLSMRNNNLAGGNNVKWSVAYTDSWGVVHTQTGNLAAASRTSNIYGFDNIIDATGNIGFGPIVSATITLTDPNFTPSANVDLHVSLVGTGTVTP